MSIIRTLYYAWIVPHYRIPWIQTYTGQKGTQTECAAWCDLMHATMLKINTKLRIVW